MNLERIGLTTLVMVVQSKGVNNNSKHPVSSSSPVLCAMCIKEGGKEVNLIGKILLISSNELHSTPFDELNYHSTNMCLTGLNDKNSPYPTHRRWMLDVPFLKNYIFCNKSCM